MPLKIIGGGSGTGSSTFTGTQVNTLFTTPNNTNSMFLVSITWSSAVLFTNGGIGSQSGVAPFNVRVGPNTAVRAVWSVSSSATINWVYNYSEITVDL